jgi:glucokinase
MKVLAADFGGTRIKLGVVAEGRVMASSVLPARARQGLARQLPLIRSTWLGLLESLDWQTTDCAGIGLSFPSLMEPGTGRVLDDFGKYRDAPRLDLRGWAGENMGLPLAIENDARMALLGEWRRGAGRGSDHVVMITLGTGVGTAAVVEGRLLRGGHGQAGVLGGHTTVRYDGEICGCGNVGCVEAEASTVVLGRWAERMPGWEASPLRRLSKVDYAAVFRWAGEGDGCATAVRDHSLRVWGALAVNLVHAYDPERVILGGGILASAESVRAAVEGWVRRHAHTPWGQVQVVVGELGDGAALVAAEDLVAEMLEGGH